MKKQRIILIYTGDFSGKRHYRIDKVFNMSEYNPGDSLLEDEMQRLVDNPKVEVEIRD